MQVHGLFESVKNLKFRIVMFIHGNVEINILFDLQSVEKNVILYVWSVEIIIFFNKMNKKKCYHQNINRCKGFKSYLSDIGLFTKRLAVT